VAEAVKNRDYWRQEKAALQQKEAALQQRQLELDKQTTALLQGDPSFHLNHFLAVVSLVSCDCVILPVGWLDCSCLYPPSPPCYWPTQL